MNIATKIMEFFENKMLQKRFFLSVKLKRIKTLFNNCY